jgi:O-antigen ligase
VALLAPRSLLRVAAVLVAVELVTIVGASSAYFPLLRVERAIRWTLLALLLVVAVALLRGARLRRPGIAVGLALAFLGLAFLSAAWSVSARITTTHAASVAVLLVVVAGLAWAAGEERAGLVALLWALVAGGVLTALAGVAVVLVSRHTGLEPASQSYPVRYRGFGGNPDTAPLLLAIVTPAAVALALRGPGRRWACAALALFAGSIAPSGSRGALLAAAAGALVTAWVVLPAWRTRALAALAVLAVAGAAVVVSALPKPLPPQAAHTPAYSPRADDVLPLDKEPGYGGSTKVFVRSLTTSSGRIVAWNGALRQARDRLVAGYGFATEDRVFVDRYPIFFARRTESSYLGTLLQLGLAGLLLLLALVGAILVGGLRALRGGGDRVLVGALAGSFVAGLLLAAVQSYMWSVGGTGALALWLVAALLVAASRTPNSA